MDFFVSGSIRGVSGQLSIIGRCGEQPIPAGAEFRTIFRTRLRRCLDQPELVREVEESRDLHIRIDSIEAYGRTVEFLPPNTTGVLRCVESSEELVPGGWILSDEQVAVGA